MTASTVQFDSIAPQLNQLVTELEDFSKTIWKDITRDVIPRWERRAYVVLSTEPPPRNRGNKFIWSFDRAAQRRAARWFFANFPDGYTRTGQQAQAWIINTLFSRQEFTVSIENPSPGASFTYGSEEYTQIPGHVETGWLNAPDTITDQVIELIGEIEDYIDQELAKALS